MPNVLPFDRPPRDRRRVITDNAELQAFLNDIQILMLHSPRAFRTLSALAHRLARKHLHRANDH